ncbi:cornifelin homolog [Latimeria chalumnae]|uniref:cornifelin homolog n=1 Tax=Latimeria chalumnae TaxID=7897 RepID=UPI00313DA6AB
MAQIVVTTQPPVAVTTYQISQRSAWSSGTCDCFNDCGICLCGAFLPYCLECRVAQDYGECCCLPCLPGTLLAMRTGMRERYQIQGSVCDDWMMIYCCYTCALCQMARELKVRR